MKLYPPINLCNIAEIILTNTLTWESCTSNSFLSLRNSSPVAAKKFLMSSFFAFDVPLLQSQDRSEESNRQINSSYQFSHIKLVSKCLPALTAWPKYVARFTYDPCFYGPSTIKSEPLPLRPQIKEKGLQCCQLLLRSHFNQETCTLR